MKTLKTLVAVLFVFATLVTVTSSFAGHGGVGAVYDCETDSFIK